MLKALRSNKQFIRLSVALVIAAILILSMDPGCLFGLCGSTGDCPEKCHLEAPDVSAGNGLSGNSPDPEVLGSTIPVTPSPREWASPLHLFKEHQNLRLCHFALELLRGPPSR